MCMQSGVSVSCECGIELVSVSCECGVFGISQCFMCMQGVRSQSVCHVHVECLELASASCACGVFGVSQCIMYMWCVSSQPVCHVHVVCLELASAACACGVFGVSQCVVCREWLGLGCHLLQVIGGGAVAFPCFFSFCNGYQIFLQSKQKRMCVNLLMVSTGEV